MKDRNYNKKSRIYPDSEFPTHTSHKKFKPRQKERRLTVEEMLRSIEDEELEEPQEQQKQ